MSETSYAYLVVNFGGPRSLAEIEPFLCSLLTDKECVRTKLPQIVHNFLFKRIAKKRAQSITSEYIQMGGSSPIYGDTEAIRSSLTEKLQAPVLAYHRYLPMTHQATFTALEQVEAERIIVFPMFPQFSYATTGSAAKQMVRHLSRGTQRKLLWVKSYAHHPEFVALFVTRIKKMMAEKKLEESKTILFFSSHGIPQQFVEEGDPYYLECLQSFENIKALFPNMLCRLAFQSKFGRGEWLRPYTEELCKEILSWHENREDVLFIPLSFTSDHIETLVEIEAQYMTLIRQAGLRAHRLDAFNREEDWIEVIIKIISNFAPVTTKMLVRDERG